MSKVILVLSDALRYDTAVEQMGFLGHLVESKLANLYKILGEIPSSSATSSSVTINLKAFKAF